MHKLWSVLLVASLAGCVRPLALQPRPVRDWPTTLQAAKDAARAGRYAEADSVLAGFGSRHAGSYQAREAAYWRALFLVDPLNPQSSSDAAFRALNQYFADGSTVEAYDEATVLRRVVQQVDSLNRALAQADRLIAEAQEAADEPRPAAPAQQAPAAAPAASAETRAQARQNRNLVEQVRRLREELSKSNQELERVRRRLSEQRP